MDDTEEPMFSSLDVSLHPPEWNEEDGEIPWVLLDRHAYVAERHNATTAFSETWRGDRIQVTLCLARPPRVSYLCVFCPGLAHSVFPLQPDILAMEEDLILLRIIVSSKSEIFEDADHYIYQATDEAAGGGPSLKRLPRLPSLPKLRSPYEFDSDQVGILRCGDRHQRRYNSLCPHRDTAGDFYIVAALCRAPNSSAPGEFAFCLYNSNSPALWMVHNVSVDENQHRLQYGCHFEHYNSKVISIGGDSGTMGFVDLWRGILFCDVLKLQRGKPTPPIRYVTLPPPLLPGVAKRGDARLARDIAVIQQGRAIKYVELVVHCKPYPNFRGKYIRDGWMSRIWTRPVDADCAADCWNPGCKQESSDIPVDSNPHFRLLPKLLDHSGMALKPFKGLFVCQPTLGLHDDDDLVYFMTKANNMDGNAWVIAVDMKNNTLQGVDEFVAERTIGVHFSYMHSRISKYLTAAPGTKGNLKRPGMVLLESSNKKFPRFWMSMPPWGDLQNQHGTEMEVDGDDMVLT